MYLANVMSDGRNVGRSGLLARNLLLTREQKVAGEVLDGSGPQARSLVIHLRAAKPGAGCAH
jgi:hypothetical protein